MISKIRKVVKNGKIVWRKHVLARLFERKIRRKDVLDVIQKGEIIEQYPDDRPYPSMLFFKFTEDKPLHVVASYDEVNKIVYIITAYEPTLGFFEKDFKTRIKK